MPDQSFHDEISGLAALRAFAATLPAICTASGYGISFHIVATPGGGGLRIDVGMSEGAPESLVVEVLGRMKVAERLLFIEKMMPELERVGASDGEVNALVEEANSLAELLRQQA